MKIKFVIRELFTTVKNFTPPVWIRHTSRTWASEHRVVHNCKIFHSPSVNVSEHTKMNFPIQRRSQLQKTSQPQCESVRLDEDELLNTELFTTVKIFTSSVWICQTLRKWTSEYRVVHYCKKLDSPSVNPSDLTKSVTLFTTVNWSTSCKFSGP